MYFCILILANDGLMDDGCAMALQVQSRLTVPLQACTCDARFEVTGASAGYLPTILRISSRLT